jgi:8-oxo-dGTP diphosphatase
MSSPPTRSQVSAGGAAFRRQDGKVEVVLISVGEKPRWQLPKGLVGKNETSEEAALREVREEGGIETELVELIETIEYWYYGGGARKVRFHKFVHFYLLRYLSGSVEDHDHEVHEARWVEIDAAVEQLAFKSEKEVVQKAKEMIQALQD